MKTSIATVSIAGDFKEKISAIANAGFDGVEIFETDFLAFDGPPSEVGDMVRDHGLEITLFQPFRDFEGMPGQQRERAFKRAEHKFELMNQLGTDLMLICSNCSPDSLGGIDRAADDLRELGELANLYGVRVGYEALAWGRHVNDHRDAWEIVRRADHDNIGLILDSFHTLARKTDVNTIRSVPADKIFIVQLADAPLIDMDLLYWSRHFRNMPGEGDLKVTDFTRAVVATGYRGPLSLEIFNDQFRGGSARSVSVDGHRSLIYLMDQVRRLEPEVNLELTNFPERISVDGIEFVEFAADSEEADELGKLFETLGFQCTGKHISKEVSLWEQGEIRLIINSEPEGFAHSSHMLRGMSVCDIGLKVENATDTVSRAEALGAKLFNQPIGPGELAIPAIRGVGGGIMHFLDDESELTKVWEKEFIGVEVKDSSFDVGLKVVDHIAQTMDYSEMLSWLLFYSSIFDTHKTPLVDVVDPGGVVRSQVVENASGSLRITLNGAENNRTVAGRFIEGSFGSSVQHIAFSTEDIFATAEALEQNGFNPLTISPNYYTDLAARFPLDDVFIGKLKDQNILYDRDDSGEFLQLYSNSLADGFFLEIVERQNGHQGYGAANAPFRIAAQRRKFPITGMPKLG